MSSTSSIDGLVSGMNTTDIINSLMQIERQPEIAMSQSVARLNARVTALQSLNSKMAAIATAAKGLNLASGWNMWTASSSQPTLATVTTGTGAVGGSLSFVVNQLATAGSQITSGSVSSTSTVVANGPILVAKGGAAIGIQSLLGSGLTLGSHSVTVTQASAGATVTGTAMAASTTISASNNTLNLNVDGVAKTFTIASGTYTQSQLAAAVQTASGGTLTATANSSGALSLATVSEGSAHSLQITGGNALGSLGLSAGSSVTGTDGILKADNGSTVTVTDVTAGNTVALTSDTGGTITVKYSGGLRTGTVSATNVSVGDGSLGAVVSAINSANAGVTATAIQNTAGTYQLQLGANNTGLAGAVTMSASAYTGLGSWNTLVAASDAQVTVGTGPGAYSKTSSSNTMTGLLPGVTLNLLKADPTTTVNVTLSADGNGLADKVQKMVDAANAALGEIKSDIAYDPTSKTAGILIGDPNVTNLQNQITRAITDVVSGGNFTSGASVGLDVDKDGTVTFDRSKFLSAYASDPSSVQKVFSQQVTATNSAISVIAGPLNPTLDSASWAVNITAAAAKGSVTGSAIGSGKLNPAETMQFRVNGTTVSYTTTNNQTLASIASGLNTSFTNAGFGLTASVSASNQLVVTTSGYGSASTFDVMTSGTNSGLPTSWTTFRGTDVAGTINGVACTGNGQLLTAPPSDPVLGGMVIQATGTTTGAFGNINMSGGIAQRLLSRSNGATDTVTGSLTLSITGSQSQVSDINKRIAAFEDRMTLRESTLKAQFSNLEVALGKLKDQQNWLSGQLAGLPQG